MKGWLAGVVAVVVAVASDAGVLCASHSGSGTVRVRTACRTTEVQLDPVALGLQGPPGPQGPGLVVKDANGSLVGVVLDGDWVVRQLGGSWRRFMANEDGFVGP